MIFIYIYISELCAGICLLFAHGAARVKVEAITWLGGRSGRGVMGSSSLARCVHVLHAYCVIAIARDADPVFR